MWRYHMQTHTQEYRTKVACDNENKNIVLSSTALARISADIKVGIEKSAYSALRGKESITELRGDDQGHSFNFEYRFWSTLQWSNSY
jgi:hypothetical protein